MFQALKKKIEDREALLSVIGLGYVGLPLVLGFCEERFNVLGFDIDPQKVDKLMAKRSYIGHIGNELIERFVSNGQLKATTDFSKISEVDVIIVCVPTPLSDHREPDVSYIEKTGEAIAPYLKRGQLVVLESTSYPGTTSEVLKPILEKSGLKSEKDFFLAFSPEREDPGNPVYSTRKIPKVVGADDRESKELAISLYGQIVVSTVPVSDAKTAEAVKVTENIFRCINIALVNELKMIYQRMGIDVWEVIEAAKTKPFGFMPFYPGPGLGGHCIPIDPFYLTWKAREYGYPTRFIELAGEINTGMPMYVIHRLMESLNANKKSLNGSKILISGFSYKRDVDDIRESPAFHICQLLEERKAEVDYYDPFVSQLQRTREFPQFAGKESIAWDLDKIASYDAVLIITDHSKVDYEGMVEVAQLVIDARNATRHVKRHREKIVLA